jgi:hypothetical protein
MNEKQFELLMEKLGQIVESLELIDSRLYALEECIWIPHNSSQTGHLLVEIQKP